MTLIRRHPLLYADLKNLGLSADALQAAAQQISQQLGGRPGSNLCYVLSALSSREFMQLIDAQQVATQSSTAPAVARSMVSLLAPWVGQFKVAVP
ncbi:MAG: hypothetical protein AAF993_02220 [Pseudomonadota bacterium]